MAQFPLEDGERLLQVPLNIIYMKSKVRASHGRAYVTDLRLIHVDTRWKRALQLLIIGWFMNGTIDLDVRWREVTTISLVRAHVWISTVDGQEHRLVCTPPKEWIKAFAQGIAAAGGRLVPAGENVWAVERAQPARAARSHDPRAGYGQIAHQALARDAGPYGYR